MDNEYPYRHTDRFEKPNSQGQVVSPYDQDSALFQDLIQRGLAPVHVESIDMSVAGQKLVNASGFHFVLYFYEKGSSTKNVVSNGYCDIWINQRNQNGSTPFPAKHARGFSGPFACLYLEWPAQTTGTKDVMCDVIVFKGAQKPWIDGEACS